MKKYIAIVLVVALGMLMLVSCGKEDTVTQTQQTTAGESAEAPQTAPGYMDKSIGAEYTAEDGTKIAIKDGAITETANGTETAKENIKVKFEMENGGVFVMELYPSYAPVTVENFCNLVSEGFYNGIIFHRVIAGFMAQGGDPMGNGTGGSDTPIVGEFANNGFVANTLSHDHGVVSMARTNDPNSASSQFFICYENAKFLDGEYAAFGKVIKGLEVVDAFAEIQTDANDKPVEEIKIKQATIISDAQYAAM